MILFFETVWQDIKVTSWVEWLAVITGVSYVIFATKRMIICWLFGIVSAALYVYICYDFELYLESYLQIFYVFMALYGWWKWNSDASGKKIKRWNLNRHILTVFACSIVSISIGYFFQNYTDQANPYIDAFTTCFSLVATYMVTTKILENWIYWVFIDIGLIALYSSRGLQLTGILYLIYTALAVVGFVTWYKQWKLQTK